MIHKKGQIKIFIYILIGIIILFFGYKAISSDKESVNFDNDRNEILNEREGVILYDSFEDGLDSDWGVQTANTDHVKSIKTNLAKNGDYVLSSKVLKDDPYVANGPRSEIFFRSEEVGYWEEGDEIWIGVSVFFSEDYIDDPASEIFWQVHEGEGKEGVPFLMHSLENKIVIEGKGFNDVTIQKTKGSWMDFVVHFKYSSTGSGVTQVYVNENLVIDKSNIKNIDGGAKLFQKFGLYKTGWKIEKQCVEDPSIPDCAGIEESIVTERELWYDEIRIAGSGASYDDVTP